ncbi:hypothetical protein [Yersinia aldovae]|nr:hypothetical protein [Yersinia aldovae]
MTKRSGRHYCVGLSVDTSSLRLLLAGKGHLFTDYYRKDAELLLSQ